MPTAFKFVDSPTASPTVFLDMNDGSTWKTLGGDFFKLPSPPLKRTIAANTMTDGGTLSAAAYDLRTIGFTLELTASTEAGREAQVDALKAQLAKPSNLLMYQSQLSANPVFFRTLRSDEYDLNMQFIPSVGWRVECNILAEPFAIGIRRDLSTVTITNDPASGTNPIKWDIAGIVGDSPTPAFVRLSNLGAGNTAVLATRSVNNPTAVTVFAQAESGTMGTDTTTQANDANFSGTGNNWTRTSFATSANFVTRNTLAVPTASSAEALRGRYRVFLRCRASAGGSVFSIRWQQNDTLADAIPGPTVTYTGTTALTILDLGVLEFPAATAAPTTIGYSGLTATYTAPTLAIQVSRTSGTASFDMDYVYLMPADERLCSVNQTQALGFIVLDGPNDTTYGMASGTTAFGATRTVDQGGGLVPRYGGLPMLVPGVTQRWHMFVPAHAITGTKTVDVSYWPRWREVATS
jgi:hypothetical protein